ncbi:MAG: sterol desaturase family protein [Pseudomonadota bacterium]
MDERLIIEWKAAIIAGFFLLIFLFERYLPAAKRPFSWTRHDGMRIMRNLGFGGLNAVLAPLIILPVSAFAVMHHLGLRPETWQGGWFILIDILILDLLIYGWHRANHQIEFLWRFHQVHHLDRFLDTTSAVRFHFGEVILSALMRIPILMLFDISFTSVVIYETVLFTSAIFQHSNLALPIKLERWLNWILVTPRWHWMHHHRIQRDTDSHYGNLLTLWDRIFCSLASGERRLDMPIGLAGSKGDAGFLELLKLPFKRQR